MAVPTAARGAKAPRGAQGAQTAQMRELQRTFAFMQLGARRWHDPSGLIQQLSLQTGIQQDAQEFNKLLMQLVERIVAKSGDPVVKSLPEQFMGK